MSYASGTVSNKRAQTQEGGPPSVPAELFWFLLDLLVKFQVALCVVLLFVMIGLVGLCHCTM